MRTAAKKRIAVSGKRQITIPMEYYQLLGIGNEVECFVRNNSLIIRPVEPETNGEFAEQILADLLTRGLSGDALMAEFRRMNRAVRPAVESMIDEADKAADGAAAYATMDDVFGTEE